MKALVLDLIFVLLVLFGLICGLYFGGVNFHLGMTLNDFPVWTYKAALFALTLLAVMVLFNPLRKDKDLYGGAHWATESEIKKMKLRTEDNGMILGVHKNKYLRMEEPLSVLVYAPPGSGKTAAIIIPSLIASGNSVIVHDPKGELYDKTGAHRGEFSNVIKFAPAESGSCQWNPLSRKELPEKWSDPEATEAEKEKSWSQIEVHVSRLAAAQLPLPKSGPEHWMRNARTLFEFWTLYLIHKNGETSIPEMLKTSLDGDTRELIEAVLDEGDELPEKVRLYANGLMSKADQEFGSIFSTFQSSLEVFLDPYVSENLSSSDFCFSDLRKECTSIYLMVANHDQGRLRTLLATFFEVATVCLISKEPEEKDCSVTLYLDEFVRLGKMEEVINLPAISRSYRANTVYVVQSVNQLDDIYTPSGAEKLRQACAYLCVFAQNEPKFAKNISESIGNKTRKKRSKSQQDVKIFGSESVSDEGVPLILPQQIQSLQFGKLLVLAQNNFENPVLADAAFWFKDPVVKPYVEKCLNSHA